MTSGRVNQKARTRAAILEGAIQILREGREPTVPEAAERALVSAATAYRYFTSAEDLQYEASSELLSFATPDGEIAQAIDAAGDDVYARLDALVRTLGWRMLVDQAPFRQQAKAAHEHWFAQHGTEEARGEARAGRRNQFLRQVLAPVEDQLDSSAHERLLAALAVGFGTEAAVSLTDVVQMEPQDAIEVMATTCRWILDGGLAEAGAYRSGPARR